MADIDELLHDASNCVNIMSVSFLTILFLNSILQLRLGGGDLFSMAINCDHIIPEYWVQ
jgi:hypothetical protein